MIRSLLMMWLLAVPAAVSAHSQSTSYLQFNVDGEHVDGQWGLPLRDAGLVIKLDDDDDGNVTSGEARRHLTYIAAYALQRLTVGGDGRSCRLAPGEHDVTELYAVIGFRADCGGEIDVLDIHYSLFFDLDPDHRGLLRIQQRDKAHAGVFSIDRQSQRFDLGRVDRLGQFGNYVTEGIWHIWIGYDHILFLVALLLPAVLRREQGQWVGVTRIEGALWGIAGVVTAFTLAHSLTLGAAVFGFITAPSQFVEAMIAVSVMIAAFNNLRPFLTKRLWLVTFAFGLIHGLGFANVLQELGLPRDAMLVSLLGFNLGVELGQLAIVAVVVPLIYLVRHTALYRRHLLPAGSGAIAGLAGLWLIERLFETDILVPALELATPEKGIYLLLIALAAGAGVFVIARYVRLSEAPAGRGLSAMAFLLITGLALAYVSSNVPLTDADERAAIMAALESRLPPALAAERSRLEAAVARLQDQADRAAIDAMTRGDVTKATRFLNARLAAAQSGGDESGVGTYGLDLAVIESTADVTAAIATLKKLTDVDAGGLPARRLLARVYQAAGEHARAADLLENTVETLDTATEDRVLAALHEELGDAAHQAGEFERAATAYGDALGLAQAEADEAGVIRLYTKLGDAFSAGHHLGNARAMYLQALSLYQAKGDDAAIASTYEKLGNVYAARGEFARAEDLHRLALQAFEQLQDRAATARQHDTLAHFAEDRRDWDSALSHYQNALDLYRDLDADADRAAARSYMARIYRMQNKLDAAEQAYREAIAIDERRGNEAGAAVNYANLGIVHQLNQDYPQAEHAFQKALSINQRIRRKTGEAANYANLGNIYRLQGRLPHALRMYEQSRALFEELGTTDKALRVSEWIAMIDGQVGQKSRPAR